MWKAKLYPVTDSQEKAVSWALLLHRMSSEKADEVKVAEWKALKRYSLEESFQMADASVLVPWEEKLENRILIERFLNRLRAGEHYVDSLKTFGITELDEKQFDIRFIKKCLLKCLKLRYHYTWRVPGGGGVYKISYNIIISYRIFSD